jgi:hypothetical protein
MVLRLNELQDIPGNQGDALAGLQSVPGMARASPGKGDLAVWGTSGDDTRVFLDGIEVPSLYHLGGFRSLVVPSFVARAEVVPAAYGARWSRALGGVALLNTAPVPDGLHGEAATNGADAWGVLGLGAGRWGARVAGHASWMDAVVTPLLAPAVRERFPFPRSWDAQAKVAVPVGERDQVEVVALAAGDDLRQVLGEADPALARASVEHRDSFRVGLTWSGSSAADRTSWQVTPFAGRDARRLERTAAGASGGLGSRSWQAGLRATFGATLAPAAGLTLGVDEQQGDRQRQPAYLAPSAGLTLGVDALASDTSAERRGGLGFPPREGDASVFGQAPPDELAFDAWRVRAADVGLFGEVDARLGPVELTAGARLAAVAVEVSSVLPPIAGAPPLGGMELDWIPEPRAAAVWSLGPRVALRAAAGSVHQGPDPMDLSAVFGAPRLGPERAWHASAGVLWRASDALSLEGTGYYRSLWALVVRSPAATPRLAQALVQDGEGRASGAQVVLRQRPWRGLSGFAAYAFGRSDRLDAPGGAWHPADDDQTHALTLAASWQAGSFRAGTRLRWATGAVRTPVVGAIWNARRDLYEPVFGPLAGARLPPFFQLDVEAGYGFVLGAARLSLVLEVLNVTNHANAEEAVYSFDYARQDALRGVPFLPTLSARVAL